MPIQYETPEYLTSEDLKSFETPDALAKSYLELNTRVKAGGLDLLPEEMRKDPTISVFKTLPDLAKGYVETKKLVGGIERAPEKPDGYKWTPMANLHANVKSEAILKELAPIVHKAGLGNKSADIVQQGVLELLSNRNAALDQQKKDLITKNETALRQEWGGEYDARFDKITKVMMNVMGPEAAADTNAIATALKGSPAFLKGMGKLIGLLSEDSIKSLGDGQEKQITDAAGADEAIAKYNAEIIKEGSKHPYWDEKHADHDKAKKKMTDLFELKNKSA